MPSFGGKSYDPRPPRRRPATPVASINRPPRKRSKTGPLVYQPVPFTGADATQAQVPPGFIRFWPPGYPANAVMVPMGNRGWNIPRSSGWEGVVRPFGLAITAWRGMPAIEATVDVIFERWEDQASIQPAWELLLGQMNHGPKATTGLLRPPAPVMVTRGSATSKITRPQDDPARWVITGIDIDEEQTVRDTDDRLLRVEAAISLMQMSTQESLRDSATTIRKVAQAHRAKPYTTKAGDTLLMIAREQLHDASRWPELKKLNPSIRDPRKKIATNTKIKLP